MIKNSRTSTVSPSLRADAHPLMPILMAMVVTIMSLGGYAAYAEPGYAHSAPGDVCAHADVPRSNSAVETPLDVQKESVHAYSVRALESQADAELAAGHPGRAILQYERARLVAPRSAAVAAGLVHAREAARLPPVESGRLAHAARLLGADEWGWIAMGGLGVCAAGLVGLAWGLVRRRGFLAMAFAGTGIAILGALAAKQVAPPPDGAVVIAADVIARIAPFAKADQAFVAPEGALVTLERTHGDFALIAGRDGRGWVPRKDVETIFPDSRNRS